MIHKIEKSSFQSRGPIQILYPGLGLSKNDSGLGSIGRIDHAKILGGGTIPMHPHINDEILSYFRTGKGIHRDSEGFEEIIGKEKLMLMKAGKYFEHEETMFSGEPLEGLQIFIRPGKKDLKPEVVFLDLEELHSENKWRLLASPDASTKFQFSSQTWLYDQKLLKGVGCELPILPKAGLSLLLYVFAGQVQINNQFSLGKKDSIVIKDEPIQIQAIEDAELVLFVTDESAEIFKGGMYSGNKINL